MEPYTLDRNYFKQDIIDDFTSLIWTERYYGDSEVEIVVPATKDMRQKLPLGIFLGIEESHEIMSIETANNTKDGQLKLNGISVLSWMNNRFIRTSPNRQDKYWLYQHGTPGVSVGFLLWEMLYYMCVEGSVYLDGSSPTGIPDPDRLAIPGLGLKDYDDSGDKVDNIAIPFGPLYDAMRELAVSHEIGMQILLESNLLKFHSFKGADRTSRQSEYPIVRFSPDLNSLTDIDELQSIATLKNIAYAFAPGIEDLGNPYKPPGSSGLTGTEYSGFDLRALQVLADDITTDLYNGDEAILLNMLNDRARKGLAENPFIAAVDGEIVPTSELKYGTDYYLGDLIELQGNTGVIQISRVIEYIRSQDASGEKAYPTVAMA